MTNRDVEAGPGRCDGCKKETTVWDLMGDYYCAECIGSEEHEDRIDVAAAQEDLAESNERIPYRQVRQEPGLVCFECGADAECEHHVVPKSLGGTKKIPLCSGCHALVHGLKSVSTSALTKAALAHKKSRGERVGKVPYGYQLNADGIHLEPSDYEQEVIATVQMLGRAGLSQRKIVAEVNRRGLASRAGKPFALRQIQRMLPQSSD
jgi:hypothetical protein